MFLSRRVATMEVEFVSIERVMDYTRLPPEGSSGAELVTWGEGVDGAPAVLAEQLALRYEDAPG